MAKESTTDAGGETSLADEVLAGNAEAVLEEAGGPYPDQKEQLHALKVEIERLKEAVSQVASGSSRLAVAQFNDVRDDVEETLKRNVFTSVAVAAFFGYLWGRAAR